MFLHEKVQKEANNDECQTTEQFGVALPSCHITDCQKGGADDNQRQTP